MPRRALFVLLFGVVAVACPSSDDDDTTPAVDDDDDTPAPDPLADTIGVFNLINVVQPDGSSYVDFSGAFGTFATVDTNTLAPGGYLGGFELGVTTFRYDLGGYPVPPAGQAEVVDLQAYLPWIPADETWWDGGSAVAAGNYLSSRFEWVSEDATASVLAYSVDDPVSPGGAAWAPGARVGFEIAGGPDVVAASFPDAIAFPDAVQLTRPAEGSTVLVPAARDLEVTWTPGSDGAAVMVILLQNLGPAYVASVEDSGRHTIPSSVLHDELYGGTYQLIVARDLEEILEHPQGDIVLRTREEARASVEFLPDLVITPGYGEPGSIGQYTIDWFTGSWDGTTLDLGEGITVGDIFPDGDDPARALVTLTILPDAQVGARTATIADTTNSYIQDVAFWIYNLPPVDDCEGADAFGPIGSGVFASSTEGLANDISSEIACLDWTLNGNDAIYRFDMFEGEELIVWLTTPAPGDGALVLLEDCEDATTAVACADVGFAGEFEELFFEAPHDGTWYLVVDAFTVAGYGTRDISFELTVFLGDLVPTLLGPGWMLPGETRVQTIPGDDVWPGGITTAQVDLGSEVTVDAVQAGAEPTLLDVTATAEALALPGPRTVTVSPSVGDPVELPDSLWITDWPSLDTCAEAMAAPSIGSGIGTGWAVGASADMVDAACFEWPTAGPEVFLPVDLAAGETLSIILEAYDFFDDAQLFVLTDCADPTSCIVEASSDLGLAGEAEAIDWSPKTPGRYYVGVGLYSPPFDSFSPAWGYELTVSIE
jgi:hypothetical protein